MDACPNWGDEQSVRLLLQRAATVPARLQEGLGRPFEAHTPQPFPLASGRHETRSIRQRKRLAGKSSRDF
jgi:hypothetical protein